MTDVINKTLDTFTDMADLKEYSNAQYKTIVAQSKKISELERKLEIVEVKLEKAEQVNTVSGALNKDQTGGSDDDGTTICLVQLALLRAASMEGELTLEECKKAEIYVKTLQAIRGKASDDKKPKDSGQALTNEQLIALMSSVEV